ncbi:ABC transporter permease [Nonomuraea gerenzanensis]|uniref:Putative glutathione transporter, permease component n=1 Tax=Nonomuraea gerenzanensis TaxID=93944 RepID=A0A1M4EHY5_9ACTN|nr:ABC transporter permease [Nonomuraea gerenzanensis]UBU09847.1 ABC transporter permease [Nonomuraea gerenzanensis]SBO98298.1 Putative glutathione transporter, permease component [Nonomuraea gerenzanensis]
MRLLRNRPLRRVAETIGILFGVAVVVFVMLRALPGDQITAGLGTEAAALTPAQRQALEQYYGLDQPLVAQFFSWLGNMFTGNFGYSARSQQSVLELTLHALPVTFELAVLSIVLALLIGVPLGTLAASRTNSARDAAGQVVSLAGLSIPAFLLATTLLSIFAASFGFNPNGQGFATLTEDPLLNLQQMLLPALVLGFGIAAPILRTTRTAVLEVRSNDFVRTARAKGVPERRLQVRHVLGNALVPIVTMTGLQFGYLLGGAVVVEQIFSVPGIGRQVLLGIQQKEYAVVQSTVLVIALAFVLVNLLTDLLYRVIDPRVRAS